MSNYDELRGWMKKTRKEGTMNRGKTRGEGKISNAMYFTTPAPNTLGGTLMPFPTVQVHSQLRS